jgi:hypothetical protein
MMPMTGARGPVSYPMLRNSAELALEKVCRAHSRPAFAQMPKEKAVRGAEPVFFYQKAGSASAGTQVDFPLERAERPAIQRLAQPAMGNCSG